MTRFAVQVGLNLARPPTLPGTILASLIEVPTNQVVNLLRGSDCALDIGCGSNGRITAETLLVGVDIFLPYLRSVREQNGRTQVVRADATYLPFRTSSFDCALALDVIEHLSKRAGYALIDEMIRVSRAMVIILTPNGYLAQSEYDDNPHQRHSSGWSTDEFERLGFSVRESQGLRLVGKRFVRGANIEIRGQLPGLHLASGWSRWGSRTYPDVLITCSRFAGAVSTTIHISLED